MDDELTEKKNLPQIVISMVYFERQISQKGLSFDIVYWRLWPLLLTWFNFNPSMDK